MRIASEAETFRPTVNQRPSSDAGGRPAAPARWPGQRRRRGCGRRRAPLRRRSRRARLGRCEPAAEVGEHVLVQRRRSPAEDLGGEASRGIGQGVDRALQDRARELLALDGSVPVGPTVRDGPAREGHGVLEVADLDDQRRRSRLEADRGVRVLRRERRRSLPGDGREALDGRGEGRDALGEPAVRRRAAPCLERGAQADHGRLRIDLALEHRQPRVAERLAVESLLSPRLRVLLDIDEIAEPEREPVAVAGSDQDAHLLFERRRDAVARGPVLERAAAARDVIGRSASGARRARGWRFRALTLTRELANRARHRLVERPPLLPRKRVAEDIVHLRRPREIRERSGAGLTCERAYPVEERRIVAAQIGQVDGGAHVARGAASSASRTSSQFIGNLPYQRRRRSGSRESDDPPREPERPRGEAVGTSGRERLCACGWPRRVAFQTIEQPGGSTDVAAQIAARLPGRGSARRRRSGRASVRRARARAR